MTLLRQSLYKHHVMGILNFFKKKPSIERRASQRVNRTFIAQCETNGKKSFSTVVDISKSGLGIYLEKIEEIGTILKVTLQYEFVKGAYNSRAFNLTLPAKVVWIKEDTPEDVLNTPEASEKKFRAGLELEALSQEVEKQYLALIQETSNPPVQS